jgi:hypothetical protein
VSGGRRRKGSVPVITAPSQPSATRSVTPTVIAKPRRSEVRARRAAQARRKRFLFGGAVAALLLLVGAVAWQWGGDDPTATTRADAQQVLLVQVLGPNKESIVQALVAHDSADAGRAAVLLVPSQLLVDAPGVGAKPLGELPTLAGDHRSAEALSDLLRVRVDHTWALTERGFAGLVQAVGGVEIDVKTPVVRNGAEVVSVGRSRLEGPAAVAYATYLASGETEQQRLARFNEVLREVLRTLPGDDASVRATVARIADQARLTTPTSELAKLLSAIRADISGDRAAYDSLPVRSIETGGGATTFGIDETGTEQVLRTLFPRAQLTRDSGAVRVLVQNGPRLPGLVESARKRLVDGGFTFVNGGNTDKPANESLVIVRDGSPEARAQGQRVASALRLPDSTLRVATQGQNVADVIVVLGRDYKT